MVMVAAELQDNIPDFILQLCVQLSSCKPREGLPIMHHHCVPPSGLTDSRICMVPDTWPAKISRVLTQAPAWPHASPACAPSRKPEARGQGLVRRDMVLAPWRCSLSNLLTDVEPLLQRGGLAHFNAFTVPSLHG